MGEIQIEDKKEEKKLNEREKKSWKESMKCEY